MKKDYRLLIRCFLTFLIFLTIPIFAWTTPVNISNTYGRSEYPSMCQDRRGWIHVVWMDNTPSNYDIYYTYYNGTSWSDTLNISNDPNTCISPDVAVDTINNVHVVWADFSNGRIKWSMYDGNSWSTPISISNDVPYACEGPELDVNPVSNYIHCVWHDLGSASTDEEMWHKYYDGNNWSSAENVSDDGVTSAWADIAVDLLGRVHCVWMDYDSGVMDSIEIYYSRFDSVSWISPVNVSKTVGGSVDPRIAIDRDNSPRIVWEERKGDYKVYYDYFDGIDWVNPVLVDTDASFTPDLSIDKDNRVHIVWKYKNGINDIFYTVYNDAIREFPPENASNTDSISLGPSVITDSEYVHLVWGEAYGSSSSDNIEIYYSRRKVSGIDERGEIITVFSLPSIASKSIPFSYSLNQSSNVKILFYDITGRMVRNKQLGLKSKGIHNCSLSLDLPSGIYFAVLKADTKIYKGKFILLTPNKGGVR